MEHRKRVKMVLEYSNKYQTEVKSHDDIYGKGKSAEAVGALDASAKYLSCMGLFYWSLGILTVTSPEPNTTHSSSLQRSFRRRPEMTVWVGE